jgi:hypothetical protein
MSIGIVRPILVYQGIVIGDKMNIPLAAIGMVLFLVGILIPIKHSLGKREKKHHRKPKKLNKRDNRKVA